MLLAIVYGWEGMLWTSSLVRKARFGSFELDSQTGELFKEDERINLHGQPIEILSLLLDHPGELAWIPALICLTNFFACFAPGRIGYSRVHMLDIDST